MFPPNLVHACVAQVSKPFQKEFYLSELSNNVENINLPIAYYFSVLEVRWERKKFEFTKDQNNVCVMLVAVFRLKKNWP